MVRQLNCQYYTDDGSLSLLLEGEDVIEFLAASIYRRFAPESGGPQSWTLPLGGNIGCDSLGLGVTSQREDTHITDTVAGRARTILSPPVRPCSLVSIS